MWRSEYELGTGGLAARSLARLRTRTITLGVASATYAHPHPTALIAPSFHIAKGL